MSQHQTDIHKFLLDYLCPRHSFDNAVIKNSYHVIRNNSHAEIEDKEQEIIIKSMNYNALIYQENIYHTIITFI